MKDVTLAGSSCRCRISISRIPVGRGVTIAGSIGIKN